MATLQPIPYIEMLNLMIVETKNELQKTEILERLAQRQAIEGTKMDMTLGMLQAKMANFKKTIAALEDFHKEALVNKIVKGV